MRCQKASLLVLMALLAAPAACRGEDPVLPPDTDAGVAADAASADAGPCDTTKPWGEPKPVEGLSVPDRSESQVSLLPDERTAVFTVSVVKTSGGTVTSAEYEVFTSARPSTNQPFGGPVPLVFPADKESRNARVNETGELLVFERGQQSEIFFSRRSAGAPQFPAGTRALASPVGFERTPFLNADGSRLYFSGRSAESITIYVAARSADSYVDVKPLEGLGGGEKIEDSNPVLSRDELTLYWVRRVVGGSTRMFRATRPSLTAPFENAAAVEELFTNGLYVAADHISADGCRLYVTIGTGTDSSIYVSSKPR